MKLTHSLTSFKYARLIIYPLVAIAILLLCSRYLYTQVMNDRPDILTLNEQVSEYYKQEYAKEAAYTKLYSEDRGGAATPQETLRIYVEKLHAQDYEGAVMMYDPRFREEELKSIYEDSKDDPTFALFYKGYTEGKHESYELLPGQYRIKFELENQNYPWSHEFYQNIHTKMWYITK